MKKGRALLISLGLLSLVSISAHAQNLLIDGDFSVNPGSGTPNAGPNNTINDQGNGAYQYDLTNNAGVAPNGGLTTGVGGTGGWTFQNGSALVGGGFTNTAIYVVYSPTSPDDWVAPAGPGNTNGYVVQLDSVSHTADANAWTTGNAIYQTVTVTAGQSYQLTFSVNTESGAGKSSLSAADVFVTNANITNTGGSQETITSGSNFTHYAGTASAGYQYQANTSNTTLYPDGATAASWSTYTLDFTATSSSIVVTFADDPLSTNSNINLEDISLTIVPEPRDWALIMLLGSIALIGLRKLRSREPRAGQLHSA